MSWYPKAGSLGFEVLCRLQWDAATRCNLGAIGGIPDALLLVA